jgi:hypothetical protein
MFEILNRYTSAVLYRSETASNARGVNLSDADLSDADLRGVNLSDAENDLYAVLAFAPAEVPALITALEQGRINGSCYYDGECGCLVGTLALAAGAKKTNVDCQIVHGLQGDSERPIERLFLAIKKGDTPETNPVAKIVHGWSE